MHLRMRACVYRRAGTIDQRPADRFDLVQGASSQQPESLERTRLGGVGGHALYDPHADLCPAQTAVMQTPLTRHPKPGILEPRV